MSANEFYKDYGDFGNWMLFAESYYKYMNSRKRLTIEKGDDNVKTEFEEGDKIYYI